MTAGCLCFRARRVSRAITRVYDEALRPLGLQATQLTLMNAIAMAGPAGSSVPRLTEVLAMDATTLSRNLRPLAAAGFVAIGRAAADRRVRTVALTEAGHARLAAALPLWQGAHARVQSALGPEAAGDLLDAFDRTTAALRPPA